MTPDLEPKDRPLYLKHIVHQVGNLRSLLGSVSRVLTRWKNPSLQIWCVPSTPDHVRVTFPLYAKAKGNNSNILSPKSQETYYFQPGKSLLEEEYHMYAQQWEPSSQCPWQAVKRSSITTTTHAHLGGSHWPSMDQTSNPWHEARKRI